MANEKVKLEVPITVKVDPKSVQKAERDLKAIQKNVAKSGSDWKKLGKISQSNAAELLKVSKVGAQFSSKLSKSASDAAKKFGVLGKAIQEAEKEATDVARKMGDTTDPHAKAALSAESKRVQETLRKLNRQVDAQKNSYTKLNKEIERSQKAQKIYTEKLNQIASFDKGSMQKGMFAGLSKMIGGSNKEALSGIKDIIVSAGKGAHGAMGRAAKESDAKRAGGNLNGSVGAMGKAVVLMGGVAAGVAMLVQLLLAASDHQTKLNKALLKGAGFANDFGMANDAYRKSVDEIRVATINSSGALLRFGKNSEQALTDINAFGMAATGSIAKTKVMLEQIGGGNLQEGVKKFATSAIVYGKALGIESADVSKMMGDFVSDIGMSHENVIGVMGDIVKTAATANIPVHKMMDVFHSVIPDVDLFNNRMEELTGTIKLLSKTMDAKGMKSFMKTMSQGFDQMDFKQRLKMAFVIGPAKVANILEKDFTASGKAIGDQFKGLGDEVQAALKQSDPVKAMAAVAAKATAMGVAPAAIGKAQELARNMANLKKGNVLNTATAMRGAGTYARMNMMEEYAGKFTGGDIGGLGEHVAKQLGVSEDQYKAILSLKDNMAMYQASLSKTGKTSSKSMNENLRRIWKTENKGMAANAVLTADQEKEFEAAMMKASTDPTAMKDMLQKAGAMQIEAAESEKQSMEDLAIEQYNMQSSISDKLESIVGFFLEKIYNVLQPILSMIEDLFDFMSAKDKQAENQVVANKQALQANVGSADAAQFQQQAIAKKEGLSKPQTDSLNNMLLAVKEASSKQVQAQYVNKDGVTVKGTGGSGYGGPGGKGPMDMIDPMIHKLGDMSVDQFKAQQKLYTNFFRGDPESDTKFLKALVDMEAAKKSGDTKAQQTAQTQLEDIAKNSMMNQFKNGQGVQAISTAGSMAAALAKSGVKMDSMPSPTQKKMTEAQKKANDLVADSNDIEKDFVAKMGGIQPSGVAGQPAAATTTAAVAAGTPAAAIVGGPASAKTAAPPPGHDDQIQIMQEQGKSQEEIVKWAADDYQNSADLLSLMKKGVKFEDSWMKNKFSNVLKESTLDSFRKALLEQTIIYAKMWDDKNFREAMGEAGKDILASGVQMSDLAGIGKDDESGIAKLLEAKKHATGLMGVPYDNYLASLHKGEIVVPASDARVASKGGGGKSVNVVVYAQGSPASEVARRIGTIANSD